MQYRRLGRTDLQISEICLGTMTWGEQNSEAEAHAQIDLALDAGVNFMDTAEMYPVPPCAETQGRTEQYIGSWFAKTGKRDKFILATKVAGPGSMNYIRSGPSLNRASVLAACETSLRRLQTDYIDLYQIHWPQRPVNSFGKLGYDGRGEDGGVPIEETLSALDELVRAGKVRHIGVSNETPWGVAEYLRLAAAHGWPRLVSIQNPYSLLNRSFEIGLAEFALREQVGLLAYSPLGMGVLSGKYLDGAKPEGARMTRFTRWTRYSNPQAEDATRAYVDLAREHGLDAAQLALAWILQQPFVSSVIIGATSVAQLRSDLGAAGLRLGADVLSAVERIHRRHTIPCP